MNHINTFRSHYRYLMVASILINLLLLGYLFYKNRSCHDKNPTSNSPSSVRIAIFEPAIHPAITEIVQGFKDTLQKNTKINYSFIEYNANGNKTLLYGQAQEIMRADYDLIFTIGFGCTHSIKEIAQKHKASMPIVFCSIYDPQRLNISNNSVITGVTEKGDYKQELELVSMLKPDLKSLVLVYDQAQGSDSGKDAEEISQILAKKGVEFKSIEIQAISDIQQKVAPFLNGTDVLMILKDHTTVSGLDSLVGLCRKFHVSLLANDLNSGIKGAVLAFGIHEYDSGKEAAIKAKHIIEDHQKPSDIPINPVENLKIHINAAQMEQQNLVIDPKTLFLLKNVVIS